MLLPGMNAEGTLMYMIGGEAVFTYDGRRESKVRQLSNITTNNQTSFKSCDNHPCGVTVNNNICMIDNKNNRVFAFSLSFRSIDI